MVDVVVADEDVGSDGALVVLAVFAPAECTASHATSPRCVEGASAGLVGVIAGGDDFSLDPDTVLGCNQPTTFSVMTVCTHLSSERRPASRCHACLAAAIGPIPAFRSVASSISA